MSKNFDKRPLKYCQIKLIWHQIKKQLVKEASEVDEPREVPLSVFILESREGDKKRFCWDLIQGSLIASENTVS